MARRVYLAGAISNLTFAEATDWREYAKRCLAPEIDAFSPLRAKDFLADRGVIDQSYGEALATDRGIMTRDHYDTRTADAVLCNLLGCQKVSIGTVMEIGWCFAYRVPLIVVAEPNHLHDHPMIREAISFYVHTLDEGIDIVRAVLLP